MLICNQCHQPMVKKQADLTLHREGFGDYVVKGVIHSACELCGGKLILPDEAIRVQKTGIKCHLVKIIELNKSMTTLELLSILKCESYLLEEILEELVKSKIIHIDGTLEIPIVKLINTKTKKNIFSSLTNFLKRK